MLFKLLNGAASPANCARKIAGPLMVLIVPSTPPCIHDEVLCRAFFRRVRSQEKSHVRNVAGKHTGLQTLAGHHFLLELWRMPQFDLPLGPDGPRRKRVDPYAEGAKFSRQHPCQSGDGSLGHVVYREGRMLEPPNNGTKIRDCASAESLHLRHDGLRREKHVSQIHRDSVIPIRRRDLIQLVTVIVPGIIDEHTDVPQLDADFFDSSLQRRDVAEVAGDEEWRRSRLFLNLNDQRPARFLRDIYETHKGPLRRESASESRTDTASSPGDEDRLVSEARVARRSACIHISQPLRLRRETLLYSFSISKEISAMCRSVRFFENAGCGSSSIISRALHRCFADWRLSTRTRRDVQARIALAPEIQIGTENAKNHEGRTADLDPAPTGTSVCFIFPGSCREREVLDRCIVRLRSSVAHRDHDYRGDQRDQHAEILEINIVDDPQERAVRVSVLKSPQAKRHGRIHNHPENAQHEANQHGPKRALSVHSLEEHAQEEHDENGRG